MTRPMPEADRTAWDETRAPFVVLLVLLGAATAIRLHALGQGLWLDEITTAVRYARPPFRDIFTTFDSENQHLLYSLLAHGSFILFGESAWALRLPAVLFGVGSIAGLYVLGREVARPLETMLAAAFLTFSYHHVWFSQNARGYSGLLFWSIASSVFFIRALRGGRTRDWIGYAVTAALGVYTHMTMVFVVSGHFLSFLLRVRQAGGKAALRGIALGFAGSVAITLLLYAPVLADIRGGMASTLTGVVAKWNSPLWTLRELLTGLSLGLSKAAVLVVGLIILGVGAVDYYRRERIVVELAVFGPAIGSVVSLALGHPIWPRFFLFAMGFFALLIFRGVLVVARRIAGLVRIPAHRIPAFQAAAGILLVAASATTVPQAWNPKQDFEGALRYVQDNRRPGDAVATVNLTVLAYSEYFHTDWQPVTSVDELSDLRNRPGRTWIVYTMPQVLTVQNPDLMAAIERDFRTVRQFGGTLGDGKIYVAIAGDGADTTLSSEGPR